MLAVLFGLLAGMLFGLLAVTVRLGLRGSADPQVGASVLTGVGFVVAAALSIPALLTNTIHAGDLWPFFVLGMLVPGCSQILFILSIRDAGPSRAAILIGTSPLISVSIALVFLNEPFEPWLLVGTALIVPDKRPCGTPVGSRDTGLKPLAFHRSNAAALSEPQ